MARERVAVAEERRGEESRKERERERERERDKA